VVGVRSADLEGRVPYLVQEFLAGGSLDERLRTGPLPVEEAVRIARQLAAGLAAAHAAGVLHRDLKPDNVLFAEDGRACLADFGLATAATGGGSLTKTGDVIGTPTYMAPEQALGTSPPDERTDVFGLGGVLYAMLTGQPPTRPRPTMLMTLSAVIEGEVTPPSKLRPDLPPWLEAVCLRALAKAPEDRFASATALAEALGEAERGHLSASGPKAQGRLGGWLALVLGGLALAGLGLWGSSGAEGEDAQARAAPREPGARAASREAALRLRVEELLHAGRGSEAWELLQEVPDEAGWSRLRGLARLADGDPEGARARLSTVADQAACRVEQTRQELEANLRVRTMETRGAPLIRAHFELARQALEDARLVARDPLVGALLVERLHETVARMVLHLEVALLSEEATRKQVDRTLALALRLEGAGRLLVELARAVYRCEWENEVGKVSKQTLAEIDRVVAAVRAREDLAPRYQWTAWALAAESRNGPDLQRRVLERPAAELPPKPWLYQEQRLLRDGLRSSAEVHEGILQRALEEQIPKTAARAYRQAVNDWLESKRRVGRNDAKYHQSRLSLAGLYLAARQPEEARAVLAEQPFSAGFELEHRYLRFEVRLLATTNHWNGASDLIALTKDPKAGLGEGSYEQFWCLQAAFKLRNGSREGGNADLSLVDRSRFSRGEAAGLANCMLGLRTPEETRAEELHGQGKRELLVRALRRPVD
jgi:hypothetical protein